ncbi:MAG: thymidine phosphorylase [Ruminococcus sp.]|nr:thymidine phosphorylase [Ruminococcus sp.]
MQVYDIITKKKRNIPLTSGEIEWLVKSYTDGEISDAQMTAFLMAVYFNSMTDEETSAMTMAMAKSGDMLDLSEIAEITVDKHSSGGVGDKTTLVIVPIVASCGVAVPKMSGRGLGMTGGTIDKLESVPGFRTAVEYDEFKEIVKKTGCAVVGQTGHLTPADKKIYALRDVTATVDSIPLIAASIMSKKLAMGDKNIVLDVKCGSGAFMKTPDEAQKLADTMVRIAENNNRNCVALVTDMNKPLGRAVGNSLEVIEAIETLRDKEKGEFYDLCIELSANMLSLAGKGSVDACRQLAVEAVSSGRALGKLREMIEAQGGNPDVVDDYTLFKQAEYSYDILAENDGVIKNVDCEEIGRVSLLLGAGREVKDAPIDHSAGVYFYKLCGENVLKGERIATLYTDKKENIDNIITRFRQAYPILSDEN